MQSDAIHSGLQRYDWQAETLAVVSVGCDVWIARLGDGKSAVFQLLACGGTGKSCRRVISPLVGLIGAQVSIA